MSPLLAQSTADTVGVAVVGGKIYHFGWNANQRYDTETNTWTAITPPPIYVGDADVVACQNKIYVVGGNPTQVYDPETDTWTTGTSMPTPRGGLGVAVVDDEIYALGGSNSDEWGYLVSANEKYTPNEYEVPEFPSWIILPLFIAVSLAVIIYRKKLTKKQSPSTFAN